MKATAFQLEINGLNARLNDIQQENNMRYIELRKDLDRTQQELIKLMSLMGDLEAPLKEILNHLSNYNRSDRK